MIKIDAHSHVLGLELGGDCTVEDLIEAMDRLDIDQACVSLPIVRSNPPPSVVRQANDIVIDAMQRYPDRLLGYCFINPGYLSESLAEMERCITGHGMIGLKLYTQYRCDDPVIFPVVERAIEWGVPLLWHVSNETDLLRGIGSGNWGNPSHAGNIVNLARRYPEAILIEGHIGGGGDWEWAIKTLRDAPNVYLDTSGTVIDEGIIDMAVRELGVESLLFATDLTMEAGVGKILAADLTEAQRERIFWRNMDSILARKKAP